MRVVGIDPGVTMGIAAVCPSEHHHACGPKDLLLLRAVRLVEMINPDLVVVEKTFVGKGARASLDVTESAGEVVGFLKAHGCLQGRQVWRPMASSWRKYLGLNRKVVSADGARCAPTTERLEGRALELFSKMTGRTAHSVHEAEAFLMAMAGVEREAQKAHGAEKRKKKNSRSKKK